MTVLTLGAAMLAGVLTILNPCVLPILPIVFGSAASEHRRGPLALAAGLASSFTAIGLFIATIGVSLGLDPDLFRSLSAALLLAFGVILATPPAQAAFQAAMAPLGAWASERSVRMPAHGLLGQFGLGALLGAAWSPCLGPTLGAASVLASQGKDLGMVALVMTLFGLGASLPLLLIGVFGRGLVARFRARLGRGGRLGKQLLGIGMAIAGLLIITGLDKQVEAFALQRSPLWLIQLTTSV